MAEIETTAPQINIVAPQTPAVDPKEAARQAFFKSNPVMNPLQADTARQATQIGVPVIEGQTPQQTVQAIVEDPNVDIGTKEKVLNNFSMSEASKQARDVSQLSKQEQALQPLFDKYQNAVKLAEMRGFKPPQLPTQLKGTVFDPQVEQAMATPDQFARPQVNQATNAESMMTPEENNLLKGLNQQIAMGNKLQQTLANAELAQQKALQNYELQSEAQALSFQQKQEQDRAQLEQMTSQIENERASFAAQKTDPSRFWNSRSTGQKIGIAIAAALSGLGQAMQGQAGGNNVLSMLQSRIDSDIDAQKQDMMNKREAIQGKESLYGKYYQLYKDDQAAYYATKAASLQQVQLQLEQTTRNVQNQFTLAQAQKLNNELETQKLQNIKAFQTTQRLKQLGQGSPKDVASKVAVIETLPEELKKQARDELGKSIQHDAAINQAKRIFKDFETKTNRLSRATGTGDADELEAELRSLLTQYVGISPKEIDNVVGPLVPGAKGTQDIKDKMTTVINILNQKRPATQVLDAYNLSTPQQADSFFSPRK